jgi:hypothetical protein
VYVHIPQFEVGIQGLQFCPAVMGMLVDHAKHELIWSFSLVTCIGYRLGQQGFMKRCD